MENKNQLLDVAKALNFVNKNLKTYSLLMTSMAIFVGFVSISTYTAAHKVPFPFNFDTYLLLLMSAFFIFFFTFIIAVWLFSPSQISKCFGKNFIKTKWRLGFKSMSLTKSFTTFIALLILPLLALLQIHTEKWWLVITLLCISLFSWGFLAYKNKMLNIWCFLHCFFLNLLFLLWIILLMSVVISLTSEIQYNEYLSLVASVALCLLFFSFLVSNKRFRFSTFLFTVLVVQLAYSIHPTSSEFFGEISLKRLGIGGGIEKVFVLAPQAIDELNRTSYKDSFNSESMFVILETGDSYYLKLSNDKEVNALKINKPDIKFVISK